MDTTRRGFLTNAAGALSVCMGHLSGGSENAGESPDEPRQEVFYREIVSASDASVPELISEIESPQARRLAVRRVGTQLETLAAAYSEPVSAYFQSGELIAAMTTASRLLRRAQHPDGTIDSGNLNSPPDTGFVLHSACPTLAVLRPLKAACLSEVKENLRDFILAGGDALTQGGIHTPNHRWVVCSALARVNSLFPARKYVARIDDWLGEGVYIDSDGQYSERSAGIYSRVIDNALVTMARLLNRPSLLTPVRKNLDMNVYYAHPDGEIEVVASRRQDQYMTCSISAYYLEYRYMAIRDNNPLYAGMARWIEGLQLQTPKRQLAPLLIHFLEEPMLKRLLPQDSPVPSTYAKVFPNSGVARIRKGEVDATIYGGSDWPLDAASGIASNPAFFNFRKGKAVLESLRMTAGFFSEGFFRSSGIRASGNRYFLEQRFEVPYYQPLPPADRNPRGDYPLTPAEDLSKHIRFWSKMNFPKRPVSNIQTLDQNITVTETNGEFEIEFNVAGHDGLAVTIEMAFRTGGTLEGPAAVQGKERAFRLKRGLGRYRVGAAVIEFGPGEDGPEWLDQEGEFYIARRQAPTASGYVVYITGLTPFQKTITIR